MICGNCDEEFDELPFRARGEEPYERDDKVFCGAECYIEFLEEKLDELTEHFRS